MMEYWKNLLGINERRQYDKLFDAAGRKATNTDLVIPLDSSRIRKVYSAVLYDHPEIYYLSPSFAYSGSIILQYLYDATTEMQINRSINLFQNQLMTINDTSDTERILSAIYLLTNHSRYEIDSICNQNMASVIHFHAAQCSGFSAAFKYAMDLLGIWAIIVSGNVENENQSGPHSWNIVKINGEYYHIDITPFSNVQLTNREQLKMYKLFKSDHDLKHDGCVWDESETPRCDGPEINLTPQNPSSTKKWVASSAMCHSTDLPVYTRLFDVQRQISETLSQRKTICEFCVRIPSYSNDKVNNYINNTIRLQANSFGIACSWKMTCSLNEFHIEFDFNN